MQRLIGVIAVVAICGLLAPTSQATVLYENDFENLSDPLTEWSSSSTDNAEAANFTRFLGQFANDSVTLSLASIIGVSYILEFDLYVIGSWDGTAPMGGPDRFTITVDGNSEFDETFANATTAPGPDFYQSFREPDVPPVGRTDLGYNPSHDDAIYRDVQIAFVATETQMDIVFQGVGLQAFPDETWGLDNVLVTGDPSIPTVSEWGLIILTLLLLTSGTLVLRSRRSVAA